jgi:hypothetical protein
VIFYLGTHVVKMLESAGVPLFLSRRVLYERRTFPRAAASWALDSGGFSELSMFGKWETTPEQYVSDVRRFYSEIGSMEWASIQDWMCEPLIIKKTGLSVLEHQRRTTDNYKRLTDLAPEIPWTPVIQGFKIDEYLNHLDMYEQAEINLYGLPVVGVGSICRRQHTNEAETILNTLASFGLRIHGFGFKLLGLDRVANVLTSADSMAWSFAARKSPPLPGCTHKNCANCSKYALQWRARVIARVGAAEKKPIQILLPMERIMQ